MSWIAESKTTFYCGFRATLQETKLLSWVAKSDAFSCGIGASLQGRVYCTPLRKEFNFESIYDRKGTQ